MKRVLPTAGAALLALGVASSSGHAQLAPAPAAAGQTRPVPATETHKLAPVASHPATPPPVGAEQTALVKQYCVGCHSDRGTAYPESVELLVELGAKNNNKCMSC